MNSSSYPLHNNSFNFYRFTLYALLARGRHLNYYGFFRLSDFPREYHFFLLDKQGFWNKSVFLRNSRFGSCPQAASIHYCDMEMDKRHPYSAYSAISLQIDNTLGVFKKWEKIEKKKRRFLCSICCFHDQFILACHKKTIVLSGTRVFICLNLRYSPRLFLLWLCLLMCKLC